MNCLDCADGAAGGTCLVAFLALAAFAASTGRFFVAQAALAGAGAVLGFLLYNVPPARVFLGDAGSTFLGLMVAVLAVLANRPSVHHWQLPLAPFVLAVPVFDIIWVHYRRYQAGIYAIRDLLSSTGKDHLPHRLMARGLSKGACMVVVASLTLLASVSVYCLIRSLWIPALMAIIAVVALLWHLEENAEVVIRPEDHVALFQLQSEGSALPSSSHAEESVA